MLWLVTVIGLFAPDVRDVKVQAQRRGARLLGHCGLGGAGFSLCGGLPRLAETRLAQNALNYQKNVLKYM